MMDKNTLIGFVLMGLVIFAMTFINQPSAEQIEAQKRYQDSIAHIELNKQIDQANDRLKEKEAERNALKMLDTLSSDEEKNAKLTAMFGLFGEAAVGEEQFIDVENELLKLRISNRGARISSVELKKYRTHDSLPLILFQKEESSFNTSYITPDNRAANTADLYFTPLPIEKTEGGQKVTMRLSAGGSSYIDYVYTVIPDQYMIHFAIEPHDMQSLLSPTMSGIDMEWKSLIRQQEKGRKFEDRYTSIYYRLAAESSADYLSESSDDSEELNEKVKWVAFKDQYFSSILIADQDFTSAKLDSRLMKNTSSGYLKDFSSKMVVPFNTRSNDPITFRYYFGPNHYPTLSAYDAGMPKDQELDIQKLVPLGAPVFRWVNMVLVIPLFNFLDNYISSFGIIIFIMTLVIKLILFPLTYKSYMSGAKMRVLRPQIEEINKSLAGEDKAMQRQQATMELYSRAGVSPMSGCLPMMLQMPILIALFMFFPSAIELRQQSFLWAHDLSTYDAIFTWDAQIPLLSTYFGNHLSLFCLLMTIVNVIYTKFNMEMTNTGQEQMPGMKMMMYIMPVMFLFIFNEYAAGLSYYYLLSTFISIIQTLMFRYFVNEDKLLAKLEANKRKPQKKGGFMSRVADMQKQQQEMLRQQQEMRSKHKK